MSYLIPQQPQKNKKGKKSSRPTSGGASRNKKKRGLPLPLIVLAGVVVIGGVVLLVLSMLNGSSAVTVATQPTVTPLPLNLGALPTSTPLPAAPTTAPTLAIQSTVTALPPTAIAAQPTAALAIDASQLEQAQAILALVNADRARAGLNPLTLNPLLLEAARIQSLDMAQGDFMSHDGSDGSDVSQRVTRVGYTWGLVGENVLQRWDVNADEAYQQWWNSPPHQENMLTPDFTEIGIAYDTATSGRVYYAMVLGTPTK